MERIYLSKVTTMLMLLVAVVAFLVGAYARPFVAVDSLQSQGGILQAANSAAGRFTLIVSPLVKTEKFLLDSQTGKIWQLVKSGDTPDKPFVCHRLSVLDDASHSSIINKTKLSYKFPNVSTFQDKSVRAKISKDKDGAEKAFNAQTFSDKATVEIITNGKVSKEMVPKDTSTNVKTGSDEMPNEKVMNEKAFRLNTVSVKTANQTDL